MTIFSCNMKLNLDYFLEKVWEYLDLVRVYTKKRGGLSKLNINYLVLFGVECRFNIRGHIAMMPARSSGTLNNVLPHTHTHTHTHTHQ